MCSRLDRALLIRDADAVVHLIFLRSSMISNTCVVMVEEVRAHDGVDGFVAMCLLDAADVPSRLYALRISQFAGTPAMHAGLSTARS